MEVDGICVTSPEKSWGPLLSLNHHQLHIVQYDSICQHMIHIARCDLICQYIIFLYSIFQHMIHIVQYDSVCQHMDLQCAIWFHMLTYGFHCTV